MIKKILLPVLFVFTGCASVQDRVMVNVNQANGTVVSADLAARYPTVEAFIHAALDNKSPAFQKRPLSEPVVWYAITNENVKSAPRTSKKPKMDLEVYCKANGGSFVANPRTDRVRNLPPDSPLITAFRAQAYAYSKGASDAVARNAFDYAYEEQARKSLGLQNQVRDTATRIINEVIIAGYVGAFECSNTVLEKSWLATVDVIGYTRDQGFYYILMMVKSHK